MTSLTRSVTAAAAIMALAAPALAQEVNIYSSRHYDSDDVLFDTYLQSIRSYFFQYPFMQLEYPGSHLHLEI